MTAVRSFTGRCDLGADPRAPVVVRLGPAIAVALAMAMAGVQAEQAWSQEAVVPLSVSQVRHPAPLPAPAEAAHQDLKTTERGGEPLDEAIFTDISPLTVPEVGIRLPPDQEE